MDVETNYWRVNKQVTNYKKYCLKLFLSFCRLKTDKAVKDKLKVYEKSVYDGNMTSGEAAERVLAAFIADQSVKHNKNSL